MKRNMLKVVAASLAGAMLLTACGGSSSATQTTAAAGDSTETSAAAEAGSTGGEKVITMAQTGDWDTFMPMNTTNAGADNVIELMFDRLMVINTDGTFEPRLAESWETNEAQDKITYHLNENAKWQDGEPVTAEDVVYSAQVASSSEFNYLRRIRMQYFAGTDETGCETGTDSVEVKALDDHTVEFTLKTPMDPAIIYALVNRDFIMPKHLLSNISDADLVNDAFWQNPVGSGPCIFDSMESGVSIEFKANKDYYLGAPDFDRLVFKKVQSSNLLSGLMSGDIDVLSGNSQIPLADWEAAKNTQGIVTKSVPTFAYQYMAMNTSRDYLTEDVRHAISLAINRQVIVDQLLQGEARIAIGPLAEDHPYFDEKLLPIEYDPEKAKSMLEAAGWDSNRELEVQVSTGNEVREKSAILIQQDLQKIGIKTKIQTLDFPTLLTNARNGDYDLCFIGSAGSVDPSESVPNVTAGYMNNFAQLSDPTLGEIGESGAKEITFEARKKIYDQYQEELFKQMPMAFLYHTNDLFAYNEKLENVREGAIDYNINKNVWEWKVNK